MRKMLKLITSLHDRERIGSKGKVVGYGHIGDGNLHLNIGTPTYDKTVLNLIEPYVYEWTGSGCETLVKLLTFVLFSITKRKY
jgi:D-2-hydroxyglutarate dehydrogenase